MARIRSTHPGQWTDDDFVTMSYPARLLAIGIRNEADDQGVFVWKPIQIKMKLFPADDVDVVALLGELIAARQVCRFEAGGRWFGAIRNFRKWQRPEKPKPGHGLPDNLREYVGLPPIDPGTDPEERPGEGDGGGDPSPTDPRPIPDASPTDPGKFPQRKEEGGNGVEEKVQKAVPSAGPTPPTPPPDDRPLDLKAEIWRRGKLFLARSGVPEPRAGPLIGRWRRDHGDGPVLDAMTRAEAECASEVVPFIEACLKGKSRHGQQRHDDPAAQRSAFDAGLAAAALRRMDPGR